MGNTAQWLVGIAVTLLGAIVGGIVFLMRESKAAGRREAKLDTALEKLSKIDTALDLIPQHQVRIGQLEEAFNVMRSDIKDLLRRPRF